MYPGSEQCFDDCTLERNVSQSVVFLGWALALVFLRWALALVVFVCVAENEELAEFE